MNSLIWNRLNGLFIITTALPYERRANRVLSVFVSRLWGDTIRGVDLSVFRALTFSFGIIFLIEVTRQPQEGQTRDGQALVKHGQFAEVPGEVRELRCKWYREQMNAFCLFTELLGH
jgi:hypothetical protein